MGAIPRPGARKVLASGLTFGAVVAAWISAPAAMSAPAGLRHLVPAVAGGQIWVSSYAGPAHGFDFATAVAVSPDGSTVFVTGRSVANGTFDYATVAYNPATGAQLWAARYNGPGNGDDFPFAITASRDGKTVYVTGKSIGSNFDFATIAYDAVTGARRWIRRYNGPGDSSDIAKSLALSPDGSTLYVTGYGGTGSGPLARYDYVTIAYSAATGAQRWTSRYNGRANVNDQARSVAVSPGGGTIYVTGRSYGRTSHFDVATVAYTASTGSQRWVSRYNGPANMDDFGTAIAASPVGSTVYVTGGARGTRLGLDFATIAYNAATGAARWTRLYNNSGSLADAATSVAVSPGGRTVLVTGDSGGPKSGPDYATIAYTAAGATRWTRRYSGTPGNNGDVPAALGLSPDGATVYVTGTSDSPTSSSDYATVAYSVATGSRLWVSRFAGLGGQEDVAAGLAVNPDGSAVYVTGFSQVSATSADFGTVAYKT